MTTETEVSVMSCKANKCHRSPATLRSQAEGGLSTVRGSVALRHLGFRLPDSKTVRECISIVLHRFYIDLHYIHRLHTLFTYPVCGTLLQQPQEANSTQSKIFLFKDANALYEL